MNRARSRKERYAAKLLFQFRVVTNRASNKRRTCEERFVLLNATSAKTALIAAKRYGNKEQLKYRNNDGAKVFFEFVGVLDLLHLGSECEQDEVWYEITEHIKPKERRRVLIPAEKKLNAIAWGRRAAQQIPPADSSAVAALRRSRG